MPHLDQMTRMDYSCSLSDFTVESATVTASAILNTSNIDVSHLTQAAAKHMLASCTQHNCNGVLVDFTVELECKPGKGSVLAAWAHDRDREMNYLWPVNATEVADRRLSCTHSGGVGRWTMPDGGRIIDVPLAAQFFCGE